MNQTGAKSGITRQIAKWVVDSQSAELPAVVEHHVRRLLVDYMAGVVAASQTEVSQAVAEHVSRHYRGDGATGVGAGRLSVLGAAFLNGTSAHGLEVDDGYTPGSVHPSSVSFPPVLAAAEGAGADRDTTIRALAVALELTCRLASAGHPATWRNHFHNTPVTGVMAGAAGVSVILGLDETQVLDALGVAGSHVGGLFAFLGQSAEVKRVHPGKASRDAIASAELAQAGVTGPRAIFEGQHGYIDAFTRGEFDHEGFVHELGESWEVLNTYVKPYPCCRHLHGPIDATLSLRAEHNIDPSEVRSVAVRTYSVASHHDNREVEGFLDAQMSIPFAIATALQFGEVGPEEFRLEARENKVVRQLTERVSVHADAFCDEEYPRQRPAVVTFAMNDGAVYERRVGQPYGEPSNPISDADITAKFMRLAGPYLGRNAEKIADSLWTFASTDLVAEVQDSLEVQR